MKEIPGYGGLYSIDESGNVTRHYKAAPDKILKTCLDHSGYPQIALNKNGKQKTFTIHKIMAITYLNHVPSGLKLVVDHINNIKTDNRIENLQLITQRENSSKDKKGTSKYVGVSWSNHAKKWKSVIIINKEYKYLGVFDKEEDAANAYQVALSNLLANNQSQPIRE